MEKDSRARDGDASNEELRTDADDDFGEVAYEERRDVCAPDIRCVHRHAWLICSLLFIIAALVLLLLSHRDAAFVALALGVSALFWNMRLKLKRQYGINKRSRKR